MAPFRIVGNLYYVGSKDLASYLITTPDGHIVINSGFEANVPMIQASIKKLGFNITDVRYLLISHAHNDHCSGAAAFKKISGALYMVMREDSDVVASGGKKDFHYGGMTDALYPPTRVDHVLEDGDVVKLGTTRLVAHRTAGHTKGCTTWAMNVSDAGKNYNVVIVGSMGVNPGYRLVGAPSYPAIEADYERAFATLRSLPCDIFLGAHGGFFDLERKARATIKQGVKAFVDPAGYAAYVAEAEEYFRSERARQLRKLYRRSVAITFDDLPYAGEGALADAQSATKKLLRALAADSVRADVFVVGKHVEVEGEKAARQQLVRAWRDAGHALHNHSYSHLHYSAVPAEDYLADVHKGEGLVAALRAERRPDTMPPYFRAPYNDLGGSQSKRDSLMALLARDGVRLAPFTVEHSDYIFNVVYRKALAANDTARAARVRREYLDFLDHAFAFAETTSQEMFKRQIPQIFLLHANTLNADCLPDMLQRLRDGGYTFVPFRKAVADSAYQTPDLFVEKWGVSWLHRWRLSMQLSSITRDEPEPPMWILDEYNDK
jgi:metallo-beta-lactamase class B